MKKYWMVLALLLPGCVLMNSAANLPDTPVPGAPAATNTAIVGIGNRSDTPAVTPSILTPTPPRPSVTRSPTSSAQKTPSPVPALSLQISYPQDESIVNTPAITVIGTTSPNAVVSVNGLLANVSPAGNFQLAISLDEGPNDIEVVASDENGNELSAILSVIYQP